MYESANRLLDLLCVKPASAYQFFLEALELTNQQYLHRLLEDKGFIDS